MNCNNCGASLSSLTCEYCGTYNADLSNPANDELNNEELLYEIDLLEHKIQKLSAMPMPENMKKKKISLLEEKLVKLKSNI